uniref:Ankyrin repeat protein n=1 Tax=Globisporangium ultimum (strain ATCC 200006 / CBS 805.95 / DAOM BR144) TaxID=431595 RepID=K3WI83_GLOUD
MIAVARGSWPTLGDDPPSARARIGNRASVIEVLQWLHIRALGGEYEAADMSSCAAYGCLDTVKYLHEACTARSAPEVMDAAAEYGHFEVAQFPHEHRSKGCTTRAMDKVAERNDLDIMRFLHENWTEGYTTAAMDAASRAGHLRMVQ